VPSGERLPGGGPWAGSRRMSMGVWATTLGFRGEGREKFVIYVLLRIQVCNKKNFARILLLIHNVYLCINVY
jgi:hypothetical protein